MGKQNRLHRYHSGRAKSVPDGDPMLFSRSRDLRKDCFHSSKTFFQLVVARALMQ